MAKKELSRNQKKEMALDLYLRTDMTQKEICAMIGWSEKTFSENKEKHGWEILKGASTVTAAKIVAQIYNQLHMATLDPNSMLSADQALKYAKTIELLSNKKVTISSVMSVFRGFNTFGISRNEKLIKEVNELQNEYINELVKSYGN